MHAFLCAAADEEAIPVHDNMKSAPSDVPARVADSAENK